jgi:nucleotide-binding universal stress UspA family protein
LIFENSTLPKRLIVCYDESLSSVNAVKQFSLLFPTWKDLPTSIVSIHPKGDNGGKIDEHMDEWLKAQFSDIERVQLEGNLQKEMINYIGKESADSLVIMGNYDGNAMSRIFHRSLANVILQETSANLFLTHD